jgi:hypothetical protein
MKKLNGLQGRAAGGAASDVIRQNSRPREVTRQTTGISMSEMVMKFQLVAKIPTPAKEAGMGHPPRVFREHRSAGRAARRER